MKRLLFAGIMIVALSACGGGGGGGSVSPSTSSGVNGGASATPTPPPTTMISGRAIDFTTGAALSGFTVTVGSQPIRTTCNASSIPNACGVPVSPLPTVTTAADGTFSVPVATGTTYMVMIAKDASFATLHRTAYAGALGDVKIMALSSDVQAWLTDINRLRSTVSFPTSYANLVIDEYAEEQAVAEAAAVAAGTKPYGDATEAVFAAAYATMPGAMYGATGVAAVEPNPLVFATTYGNGALTLPAGTPGSIASDAGWIVGEKAECTGGSWQGCPSGIGGHYTNLSNTSNVWIGLGTSSTAYPPTPGQFPYDAIIVL